MAKKPAHHVSSGQTRRTSKEVSEKLRREREAARRELEAKKEAPLAKFMDRNQDLGDKADDFGESLVRYFKSIRPAIPDRKFLSIIDKAQEDIGGKYDALAKALNIWMPKLSKLAKEYLS
jgi:hypothetical protein